MRRFRYVLVLLGVCAVGVTAALALPAFASHASTSATVTIKVTALEWKFKLSRSSVPAGTTVIFKVTNKGKAAHDFKINGKKTPLIAPGKTKSIKVVFKKATRLTYICTVKGHAKLGMTGKFSVGVKIIRTTNTTPTTTTGGAGCTAPATTVNVSMVEYRFVLDKSAVPAGCVQFVVKNNGAETHNFDITGVKAGSILSPGQTETWAVQLSAGNKDYVCDVPFHVDRGMVGVLAVT